MLLDGSNNNALTFRKFLRSPAPTSQLTGPDPQETRP